MQLVKILGYSHLMIAVGAGVTAYISGLSLGLGGDMSEAATLIGAFTGLGYTVQRLIKTRFFPLSAPPERIAFMKKYGVGLIVAWGIVFMAVIMLGAVDFSTSANALVTFLIIISIAYAAIPLREKAYLKLPLIAGVFALATVVYPVLLAGFKLSDFTPILVTVLLARFLYIAGITIPFDVRDLNIDSVNMKTMPQQIGTKRSLQRAVILVGGSGVLWAGLLIMEAIPQIVGYSLLIHAIISIPFVSPILAGRNRSEFFYSIVLDGLISFQFVILLLCYLLFQQ
ncbi:MAG: hypothetical protein O2852_03770 [Bacteroidetes bacterium]|nr:hypothetical protein [Bacteroidota bacterium]MDA0980457.1 hypothetical protein [Bacteroidota bacterium]